MEYNLKGLSVFLAMPVKGDMPVESVISLFDTVEMFRNKGIPYSVNMQIGGTLCGARSTAVAKFLKSGQNRLLFLDADMIWTPPDVLRLLAMSTVMDIVVAAYTSRQDPPQFFIKVANGSKIPLNEHGCAAIDGMGLGFAVMNRTVLEAMSAQAPIIQYMMEDPMPHVFRFNTHNGQFRGEDIEFFEDAKSLGFQCWLDPNIVVGHVGKTIFRHALLDHATRTEHQIDLGTVERQST